MNTSPIVSSIVLLALAGTSDPSFAQEVDRRHGFWIGGAIGGGINTASVSDEEYRGGVAGFIRAGGAPS